MSGGFSMYHTLGTGSPNPNAPGRPDEPNKWRPPVAANPAGYHQGGSPAVGPGPDRYPGTPLNNAPVQQESYFPQQGTPPVHSPYAQSPQQGDHNVSSLTSQMGAVGLGVEAYAQPRHKKKNRHAYHNIEGPGGGTPAFNGTPQGGTPTQFYGQPSPQVGGGAHWQEPQITPAMNQFPASANPLFSPGSQASPVQYAARSPAPPGTAVSSASGRVDPEQVPSVPRSRDAPARYYLENMYPTMEHHVPPPAIIPFVAFDQGNSSPKFARLTLNNLPISTEALAATALPLGLVLQPLAPLQEGEQPIPVLDFGDIGPPRCRRCRAYINPFMQFQAGGNKFICNMCSFPNDTPGDYFAPLDHTGVRTDRLQRPELMLGTVDFTVPKEYWSREPVALRWLFLLDVSAEAVNRGFLQGFCEGIMTALYGASDGSVSDDDDAKTSKIPKDSKVGIVTFDKEMHFYNLSSSLQSAQMMVMPDLEDPFLPFSDGLFVDPEESRVVITSLLAQLPRMFSEVKNPEPALLPTLNSAVEALAATGGKIICSLAALPTWGPGKLFLRDDGNVHNTDAEKKLLKTEHPGFIKVGEKMVKSGIGIDFFMAAPSGGYLDVATIGELFPHVRLAQTNFTRTRLCGNGRRDFLLSQLSLTTGYAQTFQRNYPQPYTRDWLSGLDEGPMFHRSAGVRIPRQLLPSQFWC
jgi:protein transport protein SEC24